KQITGPAPDRRRIGGRRIFVPFHKIRIVKDLVRLTEQRQVARIECVSLDDVEQGLLCRLPASRQGQQEGQPLPARRVLWIDLDYAAEASLGFAETIEPKQNISRRADGFERQATAVVIDRPKMSERRSCVAQIQVDIG